MRLLSLLLVLFAPPVLAQSTPPDSLASPPADVVMRHADQDVALEVAFASDGSLLSWRCVVTPHPSLCAPTATVAALAGEPTWSRDGRPDVFRLPIAFWLPPESPLPSVFVPGLDAYVPPRWRPGAPDDLIGYTEDPPLLLGGLDALQRRVRFPETARADGMEGRVFVQFIVDERGRVEAGAACVRTPDEQLCHAALDAVRDARFLPPVQRGRPVRMRYMLPISFRL